MWYVSMISVFEDEFEHDVMYKKENLEDQFLWLY